MSNTPVPFAPETLETIQRAFRLATDRRHDAVSLEHLLYAITWYGLGAMVLILLVFILRGERGSRDPAERSPHRL